MPGIIDPETLYVDNLPGIWSPVQWELSEEERVQEIQDQANASLLYSVDLPEAILRLLLNETQIQRAYEPPEGFDPEQQGEWDSTIITYQFRRPIRLVRQERDMDTIYIEYNFGELGHWAFTIEPEHVSIDRI
jgi:hypothetical protein